MALAWKAGWVHALAGSNPASSAGLTRADGRSLFVHVALNKGRCLSFGLHCSAHVGLGSPEQLIYTGGARSTSQNTAGLVVARLGWSNGAEPKQGRGRGTASAPVILLSRACARGANLVVVKNGTIDGDHGNAGRTFPGRRCVRPARYAEAAREINISGRHRS